MDASGWNMWVFRDGRKTERGEWLLNGLSAALVRVADEKDDSLSALLWAGELECALSDAQSPDEPAAAKVTDELANALITGRRPDARLMSAVRRISVPGEVGVSVAEGFAYYALHPIRFAEIAARMSNANRVRVVGIRSIGTTLSAVVAAALRAKGVEASRITVRPTGHPYNRELALSAEQHAWIDGAHDADFLVVDEGPGLSGSSFLATAEALELAGVARGRITLIGTARPVPENLRARNGEERWRRFRAEFVSADPLLPIGADVPLGGGQWRSHFLSTPEIPGSWTQLEALKFLSGDRKHFFRFEGFGRYGAEVARRAALMTEQGFAPAHRGNLLGFGCYEFVEGEPMMASALSGEVLHRLASYCAMRVREFAVGADANLNLENMLRHNWKNEFAVELGEDARLELEHPVIADGRMLPHEWLLARNGKLYKLDGVTHGDDHFFPGPCDIAWDLAGTIVEWNLAGMARETFLAEYKKQSGDDARGRLGGYLLAYAMLRCAYCKLAARAMAGTAEETRLQKDYQRYREQVASIQQSAVSGEGVEVVRA